MRRTLPRALLEKPSTKDGNPFSPGTSNGSGRARYQIAGHWLVLVCSKLGQTFVCLSALWSLSELAIPEHPVLCIGCGNT